MLFRHRKVIFLQGCDIASDRLADIRDRLFFGFALAETPWQTRTFCHPETVLTTIDNDLPQNALLLLARLLLLRILVCLRHDKHAAEQGKVRFS